MKRLLFGIVVLSLFSSQIQAVGQAALPTLLLAPGSRATGMGEAFVAVADDVYATYYNPGAMGLKPLANAWRNYRPKGKGHFTVMGAKKKLFFAERPAVWAANETGLFKFDGNNWLDYEYFFLEQNDNIEKIVKKYLGLDDSPSDEKILKAAVDTIRIINEIDSGDGEEDLPDFKMPFFIALKGMEITAIATDASDKLWIGTTEGVMTYNGAKWKKYNILDGIPHNRITCIHLGRNVWVGTPRGAARFSGGKWRTLSTKPLTGSDTVTAITSSKGKTVWIGTANGLIRKKGKKIAVFDSSNGLIDNRVSGVAIDQDRNVWVGTKGGVSRYRLRTWKKYRMEDNQINTISVDSRDFIWVGTNKGALRFSKGKTKIKKGKKVLVGSGWKHFHSKNGLPSDKVYDIVIQEKDVWFLTDRGIARYDKADREIGAFFEYLLPEFQLQDLYHLYFSTTWPTEDWGTLGGFVKYVSFGENEWTDEVGRFLGTFNSYDLFFGVTYGTNFGDNIGVGISPKFIYSKLADVPVGNESRRGIANSFAVDFGYKHTNVLKKTDVGITLQNMGPDIVYIDQNQADPLPYNLKAGVAWRAIDNPIHNLKILFDVNRELIRRRDDDETIKKEGKPLPPDPFWLATVTTFTDDPWRQEISEFIYSLGTEYWYSNFIALRLGTMFDKAGSREELTFGIGINYGNVHFNGSYIVGNTFIDDFLVKDRLPGPEIGDGGSGSARNKQLRLSLIFKY